MNYYGIYEKLVKTGYKVVYVKTYPQESGGNFMRMLTNFCNCAATDPMEFISYDTYDQFMKRYTPEAKDFDHKWTGDLMGCVYDGFIGYMYVLMEHAVDKNGVRDSLNGYFIPTIKGDAITRLVYIEESIFIDHEKEPEQQVTTIDRITEDTVRSLNDEGKIVVPVVCPSAICNHELYTSLCEYTKSDLVKEMERTGRLRFEVHDMPLQSYLFYVSTWSLVRMFNTSLSNNMLRCTIDRVIHDSKRNQVYIVINHPSPLLEQSLWTQEGYFYPRIITAPDDKQQKECCRCVNLDFLTGECEGIAEEIKNQWKRLAKNGTGATPSNDVGNEETES